MFQPECAPAVAEGYGAGTRKGPMCEDQKAGNSVGSCCLPSRTNGQCDIVRRWSDPEPPSIRGVRRIPARSQAAWRCGALYAGAFRWGDTHRGVSGVRVLRRADATFGGGSFAGGSLGRLTGYKGTPSQQWRSWGNHRRRGLRCGGLLRRAGGRVCCRADCGGAERVSCSVRSRSSAKRSFIFW